MESGFIYAILSAFILVLRHPLFSFLKLCQKKCCWSCRFLDLIRWEARCKQRFTNNSKEQKLKNRFLWFKKSLLERQTYKILARNSSYNEDTLQCTFYALLEKAPKIKIIKRKTVNLRMDATYFSSFCFSGIKGSL